MPLTTISEEEWGQIWTALNWQLPEALPLLIEKGYRNVELKYQRAMVTVFEEAMFADVTDTTLKSEAFIGYTSSQYDATPSSSLPSVLYWLLGRGDFSQSKQTNIDSSMVKYGPGNGDLLQYDYPEQELYAEIIKMPLAKISEEDYEILVSYIEYHSGELIYEYLLDELAVFDLYETETLRLSFNELLGYN